MDRAACKVLAILSLLHLTHGVQVMNCTFTRYVFGFPMQDFTYCMYSQSLTDYFQWNLGNTDTFTADTGPSVDHTGGRGGHFAYIESSYKLNGSYARLSSPTYSKPVADSGGCVQFYYHMYGADIGTLNVSVYDNTQSGLVANWQKSGDQGNQWLRTDIDLNLPSGTQLDMQIIIDAHVAGSGGDNKGDIAIDDIIVNTAGSCSQVSGSDIFQTTISPPVTTTRSTERGSSITVQDGKSSTTSANDRRTPEQITPPAPMRTCETRNITVTLQKGETRADVEVSARKWLNLEAGVHVYTDLSVNCTVVVNVVPSVSSKTACPESITRVASSNTKTAAVEIPGKPEGSKLELPVGKFSLNIPHNSVICNITINVVDPNIRRRVVFQANYDVKCDQAVAAVAKNIIFATAQQHFEQIKQLCSKYCKPIVTRKPIIACANDKLTIRWPTNPVYGGEIVVIKPDVKSALRQQISSISVSTLSLVVASKIPPIVYPVRNPDGDFATFSLMTFCVGNSIYNDQSGRCQ